MARYISEPARRVPVSGSYDVVVVGGGIAGVAAAVAAARCGASVCLLEKECALGGLATLANVIVYLPLCDGMGRKVIGGLGEELLKLSVHDRPEAIPACWRRGGDKAERPRKRYRVNFNPAVYMLALEALVLKEGVTLCYDTRFCDVVRKGARVTAVIVENKSGRSALTCGAVIDASGDADVCARAGEETVSLRTNVRAGWYYYRAGGAPKLSCLSKPFDSYGRKHPRGGRGYGGEIAEDVTAQMVDTRKLMRKQLPALARGGEPVEPLILPLIPSFRMTRRLRGRFELEESDDHGWFADVIGMTGDWRKRGPVYALPFRCLTGVKTDNLLVAGRCISAGNSAWDVTRVIPTCAVTGEAAGTAAALACAEARGRVSKLHFGRLRARLDAQGVMIDRPSDFREGDER